MAKKNHIKSMCTELEWKIKTIQQKISVSQGELFALNDQQQLITQSHQGLSMTLGEASNALLCWNMNQFSFVINEVLLLLNQKVAEKQRELNRLWMLLEDHKKKAHALKYLSQKIEKSEAKRVTQFLKNEDEFIWSGR